MTSPPAMLLDQLAALLGPKGYTAAPAELEPWLIDWRGRYQGAAAALLAPGDTAEVQQIVRLCSQYRVPLVPQGGNTSMVGGAIPDRTGNALLLSLRRMHSIRHVDRQENSMVCEAGVVLADVHDAADKCGRRFPLTLGARGSATVGGLVSSNAGGTQVLRFGTMRALVQGLEAVLPDGSLYAGLRPLKKDNRGYQLDGLLVGAEGTLGVVTAANLKLVPAIGSRAVAWVGLDRPQTAARLLRFLEQRLPDAVESFELVPQASLNLVLRHIPDTRAPLVAGQPWNVLIEATAPAGAPPPDLEAALAEGAGQGLLDDAVLAASETQAEALWRLRDSISEAEKRDGPAAKHDISVPVDAMPGFIVDATRAVEARFPGTRVNAFGHLGDGNVHFNVRAPADSGDNWLQREGGAISRYVHDLVTAAGGSISAEHGIGQMKIDELARLGDPVRLAAMRAIKLALDPHGIMNPGKLVPLADSPTRS